MKTSQKKYTFGLKLFQLLRSLNDEEFRRFGKFLRSPLHNHSKPLIRMYDFLKKYYPDFDTPGLYQEKFWKKLFPEEAFEQTKLWRFTSKAIQQVEKFIAIQELEYRPDEEQSLLIKALGRRNLFDRLEKEALRRLREMETSPSRDINYYKQRIELEETLYFHLLKDKYDRTDQLLKALSEDVDRHFALHKLRLNCVLQNRNNIILNEQYSLRFINAIEAEQTQSFLADNQLAQIYTNLAELQKSGRQEAYLQLKDSFFKHIDLLSSSDLSIIFTAGINYPISKINQGKTAFYKEALDWYKKGIEYRLIFSNNRMSEVTYSNIILLGCREEDFSWTKNFINDYQHFLDERIRLDAKTHNSALLLFHQGAFEQALSELNKHTFSKSFHLKTRLTMIRATFELLLNDSAYHELLANKITAFERYLSRDRTIVNRQIEAYKNCIRLIKGIAIKISAREDHAKISSWALQELNTEKSVIARDWLIEKCNALNHQGNQKE